MKKQNIWGFVIMLLSWNFQNHYTGAAQCLSAENSEDNISRFFESKRINKLHGLNDTSVSSIYLCDHVCKKTLNCTGVSFSKEIQSSHNNSSSNNLKNNSNINGMCRLFNGSGLTSLMTDDVDFNSILIMNTSCNAESRALEGWSIWEYPSSGDSNYHDTLQLRTRVCNNPIPKCDGDYCTGSSVEQRKCDADCLEEENLLALKDGRYFMNISGNRVAVYKAKIYGWHWITLTNRKPVSILFNRKWDEYKRGFGSLSTDRWLGLENLHQLTKDRVRKLLLQIEQEGTIRSERIFSSFRIRNESDGYAIELGGEDFSNEIGLVKDFSILNGQKFSTPDRNNRNSTENCASLLSCGWWFDVECDPDLTFTVEDKSTWAAGNTLPSNVTSGLALRLQIY